MRVSAAIIVAFTVLGASPVIASIRTERSIWFYLAADKPSWCAVTREPDARAVAKSGAIDSGESAILRVHGNAVDSVVFVTQSEDYVAFDTYKFEPGLRLISVERRGGYAEGPVFTVTFTPDRTGKLRLTPQGRIEKSKQESAGHEIDFVDWSLYRRFADFPFSKLVVMKPALAISQPCAARLLHETR